MLILEGMNLHIKIHTPADFWKYLFQDTKAGRNVNEQEVRYKKPDAEKKPYGQALGKFRTLPFVLLTFA